MSKKIALIDDINIINIVMVESKEIAEQLFNFTCIEIPDNSSIDIEWKFNVETQEFYLPEMEE